VKMTSEKFCLRWNDFESNISIAFRELRDDKDFFDVTLACDDEQLQAHKVILSACSPFFRNVLRRNPHQHPLLYLKGVKYSDLQSVLNFMYHGEVNVAQEELNSFLAVAEDLRVKGLTQNQGGQQSSRPKETSSSGYSAPRSPPPKPRPPPDREPLVQQQPPKRPRQNAGNSYSHAEDDDIQEVVPVKTEPREVAVAPPVPVAAPAPVVQPQQQSSYMQQQQEPSGQLQQLDDSMQYQEESYEDYGQYEAEGAYEDQTVATVDGSKGELADLGEIAELVKSPEDFKQFIRKGEMGNSFCGICFNFTNKTSTNVKFHIESKHFPNMFTYTCEECEMTFGTNTGLNIHRRRHHKKC